MNARWRVLSEREQGFSLVELIVAMFILGLILTLLIGIQISSMVTVAEARKREQATAFANEAMEQMRAIPWAVLASGLDDNYNDGNVDPNINSSTGRLEVGGVARTVRTSVQDTTPEWTPILMDPDGTGYTAGSNMQVRQDPSLAGTDFTVRSYVLEPTVADNSIVTLAAVVNWTGPGGRPSQTVIWSEAFRGDACNSAQQAVQPFLTGCQAYFSAESASGTFSTYVDASMTPPTGPPTAVNLLYPTGDIFYSFYVRSASTSSILQSQQVTNAVGYLQYGATSVDDNNPNTQVSDSGWLNGGLGFELAADNDVASALTTNPSDVTVSLTGGDENIRYVTTGGTGIDFWARSDYARPGSIDASMTNSCVTGVPADSGCAHASLGNNASIASGSAYMIMDIDGNQIRLARRLAESSANSDDAWVARFPTAAATDPSVGCVTNSEPGCVSAGASRSSADVSVGAVIGGDWGGAAPSGLVRVEGNAGSCSRYTESVLVQRGLGFEETDPISTRCGTVFWWTGTGPHGGYEAFNLSASTARTEITEPVTATFGGYEVTASAGVTVTGAVDDEDGTDPDCIDEACIATVDSGSVTITASYTIASTADPTLVYTVTATTQLSGMRASATYLEPSDA